MYKSFSSVLVLLLFIFTTSCSTKKKVVVDKTKETPYAFNFSKKETLSEVLDQAKGTGKLIYLDVSAEWCTPCQLMKRDVYTHQATADFFNENFITYLVDAEKNEGPDINLIYSVKNYPTLLILDSRGRVLSRKEGGTFHEALIKFGKEAMMANPTM